MSDENVAESITQAFGWSDDNMVEAVKDSFRMYNPGTAEFVGFVEVLELLADNAKRIAHAITPTDAAMGDCPTGEGKVGSLTEAVMGLTRAMMQIASSIQSVADAIESHS